MKEEYDIGYKKPPCETRFKPGQSGNRKGRPKRSKDTLQLIGKELDKLVPIFEGNKQVKKTKKEILITQMVNNALKGKINGINALLKYMRKLDKLNYIKENGAYDFDMTGEFNDVK